MKEISFASLVLKLAALTLTLSSLAQAYARNWEPAWWYGLGAVVLLGIATTDITFGDK